MPRKPTVVSTFAGCGGSSLGYQMSGFKELLAVEWDDRAVETFKLNFQRVPVWKGDIHDLASDELMRLAGIKRGELDVLDGSPPCQGFSTAGKRREDDTRNTLTLEYVRILRDLQPRSFVMENVAGLIKGKMAKFYIEFMAQLRGCGYRAAGALLDAAHYGVPQSRPRVIVVGFRNDLDIEPSHPAPSVKRLVTAGEAIADVKGLEHEAERAWMLSYCERPDLASFCKWDMTRVGERVADAMAIPANAFAARKHNPRRPAFTLIRNDGNLGMHGSMHWSEKRRFTVAEYRRLFGYPDDFQFPKVEATKTVPEVGRTWSHAVRAICNSVPPPLMAAVSRHVKMCLSGATEPKRKRCRTQSATTGSSSSRSQGPRRFDARAVVRR